MKHVTHVDSTSVQSLLQVGSHEAGADSGTNLKAPNSSSHSNVLDSNVAINRSDSANTKPVPVPRGKSVKEDHGESENNEVHLEMAVDKSGSLERLPPKLPPRPGSDNVGSETPRLPERVHTVSSHHSPPELPKMPCSTGQNIHTSHNTSTNAPIVPTRTDLDKNEETFPIAPPRKGRKKID